MQNPLCLLLMKERCRFHSKGEHESALALPHPHKIQQKKFFLRGEKERFPFMAATEVVSAEEFSGAARLRRDL